MKKQQMQLATVLAAVLCMVWMLSALAALTLPEKSYEQYVEAYGLKQGRRQLLNDTLAASQRWEERDYGLGAQTLFVLPECYASVRNDPETDEYVVLLTDAQDEDSRALRALLEQWGMKTERAGWSANESAYWRNEFARRAAALPEVVGCYSDDAAGQLVVQLTENTPEAREKVAALFENKAPLRFEQGMPAGVDDEGADVDEATWELPAF